MPKTITRRRIRLAQVAGLHLSLRVARATDRAGIIRVIDAVGGERRFLQTDHYVPTPAWEQALSQGFNAREGILLMAIECEQGVVGFGRLTPDDGPGCPRTVGNIGLTLLPVIRSHGIGAQVLEYLISVAPGLGFDKLTADILTGNVPSRRLFARYHFQQESFREVSPAYRNARATEVRVSLDLKKEAHR